jgi:hypothetical protein
MTLISLVLLPSSCVTIFLYCKREEREGGTRRKTERIYKRESYSERFGFIDQHDENKER